MMSHTPPTPLRSSSSFLSLTLLLSFILLGVHTHARAYERNLSSFGHKPSSQVVQDEYIVFFNEYHPHEDHRSLIRNLIDDDSSGWEIIPRNNAASRFPSDFALIKVSSPLSTFVIPALRSASSIVKDVVPQRRYQSLLSYHLQSVPLDEIVGMDQSHNGTAIYATGRKHANFPTDEDTSFSSASTTRKLHSGLMQVAHLLEADYFWDKGITGAGVKVAVFDTGLRIDHPHFRNIMERTDWTDENTLEDSLGHGTFVTGVIASQSECLGFAPDVDIHVFRVFTNERVSYTSWFLDAFNYAIMMKVDVLNLSIGGPDFLDKPFVEKVWELSANNIITVSAIGNDGPLYGTLNNPADQADVIGVGGIDFHENMASFSSRGMTTWELPQGYGRVKPDIVTFGQGVSGSRPYGGCRSLSGTSVASPVVAGAVALIISAIREDDGGEMINPASVKQALIESAVPIPNAHIFEQGYGQLNLIGAYQSLKDNAPRVTFAPDALDFTKAPYMWPYHTQPIYATGMPLVSNVTIYNGISVSSDIHGEPEWTAGENGHVLEVEMTHCGKLWPWTGWLGLRVRVAKEYREFEGTAQGLVTVTVISHTHSRGNVTSTIQLPLRVAVIPTPRRQQRILFDAYHNLRYPSGYFPRDVLSSSEEPFDWNGDHPHTNFKDLYSFLRGAGYFLEILGQPFTCFNASNYGVLMLVDPEEEYHTEEVKKLQKDVTSKGLSLVVFADWYNVDVMRKIKFYDSNTERWWTPATGGSNVPALNDLLEGFGIAFGDGVYDGEFQFGANKAWFASGTSLVRFPKGGSLMYAALQDQARSLLRGKVEKRSVPILGLLSTRMAANSSIAGRIAVFGDASCLDDANQHPRCFWLLSALLQYAARGLLDENVLFGRYLESHLAIGSTLPTRMEGSDFPTHSRVLGSLCVCTERNYQSFNGTLDTIQIAWEEPLDASDRSLAKDRLRDKELVKRGISVDFSAYYVLPYILVVAAFVSLVVVAMKSRKAQRILHQRLLV